MSAINIIDALEDPDLFGGLFDRPSWAPWKAYLRALFALPLDAVALALYQHHTGRTQPPAAAFREACLICGRRGGKSRILALLGVFLGAVLDHTAHLVPGETPVVAIIAADRKQARVILNYVTGLLRIVPALAAMVEDELAETVRLSNGVAIEVHTGSVGAPRGRTFIAVLADEIAFWTTDAGAANPDKEIIAAVRPGLATLPGSMLLIASSPYAKRGVLWETHSRYFGKDSAPVLVWRGTTREMNSGIDQRIIDEAYEADPESAAAEYGAEFRTDITAFIGRDAVEAVVADGMLEVPPAAGLVYAGFLDPSGGSADSMTLAIGHVGSDGIAVLDAVRERKPPFSPEDVTAEFAALLRAYGVTRVSGDAYAGEWPRERFATHGITYEVSARNKNAIYQDFLPALNGRRLRLLDQPRLIAQLCNLERRTARGGRDSIDHGPGQHDDVANAVAGVLTSIINERRPALIRQADLLAGNRPVPLPERAQCVLSTLIVGADGIAATAFFATDHRVLGRPLVLADFDIGPMTGQTIATMIDRLRDLGDEVRADHRLAFVQEPILMHVHLGGRTAETIPAELLQDPGALGLSAAGHVTAGMVKIAERAAEKAQTHPLAGALNFRSGEALDDPLRLALLAGIALAINPESARSAPVERTRP